MSKHSNANPFLKWAGGKRWLINQYPELFPEHISHLIEPFCGSAAVFFALRPINATLADSNSRLIEAYFAIKDNVKKFLFHFHYFAAHHSVEFYYEIRNLHLPTPQERAAQFVYLNRVCFNGIYRENLNGKFNVPIGSKTRVLLDTDDFTSVLRALQSATIISSDFEVTINSAESGSLLYVDPPYVTRHNFNGFAKYNQRIFSWSDQKRLADAVMRASRRGVFVILTNADYVDVRALYERKFRVFSVSRASVIASRAKFRGEITEMVATNVC